MLSVTLAALAIGSLLIPEWLGRTQGTPTGVQPSLLRTPEDGLRIVVRTARNLTLQDDPDAVAERLREQGVTEAWVQFKQDDTDEVTGGAAFFPSAFAPVADGYGDDRIATFIQSLDKRGIRVAGWVPSFNDATAAHAHPDWQAQRLDPRTGERTPQGTWLCPRHPEAVAYEAAILAEVAERYPQLDAIYTDFIRFDSDFSCVCDRCLGAVAEFAGRDSLDATALVDAASKREELWSDWTACRAQAICSAVDEFRDAIDAVREDLWFGACVLPFSAEDYSFNTQSGQDLYEMARVGLDEIVVMGYWDDWGKSLRWLTNCLHSANDLVANECRLTCLLDGDMSTARTWRTLEAAKDFGDRLGFFHYGRWTEREFDVIRGAHAGFARGPRPRAGTIHVAVRIDTEPDYRGSYDDVHPEMIDRIVDMLDEVGVKGTFVTCGRLAELEAEPLRRAVAHGHEIACHAYDHEQLDALTADEQDAALSRAFAAFDAAGLKISGFGAPRNSVTPLVRRRLLERGIEWDGSAAYDPTSTTLDPWIELHPDHDDRSLLVIPFVIPNDWDALFVGGDSPQRMLTKWNERLDLAIEQDESVFVIDVHQWIASRDAELAVLREFLNGAKSRSECRVVSVREAARAARQHIHDIEQAAASATSGRRAPSASGEGSGT